MGAIGIDNVWYDLDSQGKPTPGGGNPIWHALNLQNGIVPSYLDAYKVTDKALVGTYVPYYSSTMVAPWLWNATKKVFISTETTQSIAAKAQYIVNNNIGGVMIWEMAGDYAWDATRNGGKGEYFMGTTLTDVLYQAFRTAGVYGNKRAEIAMPATAANVSISLGGWKLGDKQLSHQSGDDGEEQHHVDLAGRQRGGVRLSRVGAIGHERPVGLRLDGDQCRLHGTEQYRRLHEELQPRPLCDSRLAIAGAGRLRGADPELPPANLGTGQLHGDRGRHQICVDARVSGIAGGIAVSCDAVK